MSVAEGLVEFLQTVSPEKASALTRERLTFTQAVVERDKALAEARDLLKEWGRTPRADDPAWEELLRRTGNFLAKLDGEDE